MLTKRNGIYGIDVRLPDGTRLRKSLNTRDKEQANLKASQSLAEALQAAQIKPVGITTPKGTITLKAAFKKAMREREEWRDSKSPTTLEGNFKALCEYFNEEGDLTEVTYAKSLEYAEKLRKVNTSPSTINQRLSLLSVLIAMAGSLWHLPLTPFKMPRSKIRRGRVRTVSQQEEATVLGLLKDDMPMHRLVTCLVDTGARLSEMLNLDIARDAHLDRNVIMIWENKADHPRQVPMSKRVRKIMESHKESSTSPFGTLDVYSADKRWAAIRELMKLQGDTEFVLHALRHTTASRLAASGVDAFRIQQWMGHKNIATTQIYVTLFAQDLQSLTSVLDGYSNETKSVTKEVGKVSDCSQGELCVPS